ncbi:MAG TPA: hypothetical protein VHT92_00235 [Candidatus Cybelea sp.]|nr:hypothetical protein [Candidatus Cybelea sp.]
MTRKMIAVLLLAAALPIRSAAAQSLGDPYQIFARARAYWQQQTYPPLLEYAVAVTVFEGGSVKTERYWSAYDTSNQEITVDTVSDYEQAHPTYAARGLNFVVHGEGYNIPFLSHLIKPQPPTDYLGVPLLAPNYTFGLAQIPPTGSATPSPMDVVGEVRASFHDPAPANRPSPSAPPSALPIIEKETVYGRNYRVTLDDIESAYGVSAYHLSLQALRDPGRYRLEELWVDVRNFAPIQLVERFNFAEGPGTSVPWRVRFAKVDGALYIYDETALRPMHFDGLVYPHATVAFENIRAVDELSRPPPPLAAEAPLIMTEP